MHHFGEGFVRTPDDLGTQSEAAIAPRIARLSRQLFHGARLVAEEAAQADHALARLSGEQRTRNAEFEAIDPENRLLWRANVRRLDFEAMRDSLLVFSGNLDRTIGGKPINLTDEPYSYRRSVYGYIDRGNLPELMSALRLQRSRHAELEAHHDHRPAAGALPDEQLDVRGRRAQDCRPPGSHAGRAPTSTGSPLSTGSSSSVLRR